MNKHLTVRRTRFAPSPTGNLHIGGARTALFNYLFAKKKGGRFILRIEDTDLGRSKQEFAEQLFKELSWLGLLPDESSFVKPDCLIKEDKYYGPYRQSDRKEIYQKHIDILLTSKKAYYCFCSEQELAAERESYFLSTQKKNYQYSRKCWFLTDEEKKEKLKKTTNYLIRFLIDQTKKYDFKDLLRGNISIEGENLEDFVIYRSDWTPLYNLAAVIDDHLMNITHVIRGEDHITNTHKQVALYRAFNWKPPKFVHLAIILDEKSQKLSKRNLDSDQFQYIGQLRDKGYLPEAIINYLLLLGWHPKTNREFFSLKESVKFFSLRGLQTSGAIYDINKLNWYNKCYFQKMPFSNFKNQSLEFLRSVYNLDDVNEHGLEKVLMIFRNQINCFQDLVPLMEFFFKEPLKVELINEEKEQFVKTVLKGLEDIEITKWTPEEIRNFLVKTIAFEKRGEIYPLLREILTQKKHGLELPIIIYCLEKDVVIKRLVKNLKEFKKI